MERVNFDKRIGNLCKVNILDDLLCKAVQEGNYITARRLINQGACIEITENGKEEPIVMDNETELVIKKSGEKEKGYKISIQGYTANPKCYESLPLCLAIEANDPEMAGMLIDSGCDLNNVKDSFVYAAKEGFTQIVELLINKGIDIAYNNYQALKYAMSSNRTEVVKILVRESDEITPEHYNALEYAAVNGVKDLLKILIDRGVDLDGYTTKPLRLATKCGQTEIVEMLLASGAKVTEDDFEAAKECKRMEIAEIIRDALDN